MKYIYFSLAIAFTCFSCAKEYTCTCTGSDGSFSQSNGTVVGFGMAQAEQDCTGGVNSSSSFNSRTGGSSSTVTTTCVFERE